MPLDVKKIREDFPILSRRVRGKPLVYLDRMRVRGTARGPVPGGEPPGKIYFCNPPVEVHKLTG